MASNKMLIDASHPEETRVAVVRGNRIEEFDFESQEKAQIRGNIYLAKVTRVEPSLQAAFVDYGGNRHGFLAFSEIHPDYYQIPFADRQALLEEEAAESRAQNDDGDDDFDNTIEASVVEGDEEPVEEAPKKPRRRRSRSNTRKASEDTSDQDDNAKPSEAPEGTDASDQVDASTDDEAASGEASGADAKTTPDEAGKAGVDADSSGDAAEAEAEAEEKPAPKRRARTTRAPARKKAAAKTKTEEPAGEADGPEAAAEAAPSEDTTDAAAPESDETPRTISAAIESDSISEPASGDGDDGDDKGDDQAENASAEPVADEKPKRRNTRRARKPKAEADSEAAAAEEDGAVAEEAVKAPAGSSDEPAETPDETDAGEEAAVEEQAEERPAPRKRRSRRKPKAEATEASDQEDGDDDEAETSENGSNGEDKDVESVGQEDALEEVPVRRKSRRQYKIQEVIKRRQVLLVQVVKEERGNKGAALTTYLSLAGRYSVLMPNTARGGGISRKITNAADRKRLKSIAQELEVPEGMGVILRTAGASRTKAEINRDFDYLMRLWENVRSLTLSSSAPCLVYEEGSLIKRSIRDLYNKDISEIVVSGEAGYREAKDFMRMLMPSHTKHVRFHTEEQALFSRYGVESNLDKMMTPQVSLKSGGYLVINQTEALVAIDVNSGRSTREHSIEDTALQTNLEAADEVARQLRLRDLAGLIVIDFIDMEENRNNRAVEKRLKECLKHDRARIQVGRISHFGLLEMSRQRMRASVLESTMDQCPHCHGGGLVRSESGIALHVVRAIEEHLMRHSRFEVVVKMVPAIALQILNSKRQSLVDLEERFGTRIIFADSGENYGQEFTIEKGEPSKGEPKKPQHIQPDTLDFDEDDDTSSAWDADEAAQMQERSNDRGTNDDGDEENGRKKKRRRKRGKRNRDEGSDARSTSDDDQETDDEDDGDDDRSQTASDDGDDDSRGRKRRRRGKRGGRRNRKGDEDQGDQDSDSNAELTGENQGTADVDYEARDAMPKGQEPVGDTETPSETHADDVKTDAAPAQDDVAEEASRGAGSETAVVSADSNEEPMEATSPRGRNTRRKPVPASAEVEVKVKSETTSQEADKPKKGWWNRGFFS